MPECYCGFVAADEGEMVDHLSSRYALRGECGNDDIEGVIA